VSYFAAAQGVCEVVEILDRFVAELNQHVAGLQSGLGCRRSRTHVRKPHSIFYLSKIGNGTEIGAVAAATRRRRRSVLDYGDEAGPLGGRSELLRDALHQS